MAGGARSTSSGKCRTSTPTCSSSRSRGRRMATAPEHGRPWSPAELGYSVVAEVGLAHGRLLRSPPDRVHPVGTAHRTLANGLPARRRALADGVPSRPAPGPRRERGGLALLSRVPVHHCTVIPPQEAPPRCGPPGGHRRRRRVGRRRAGGVRNPHVPHHPRLARPVPPPERPASPADERRGAGRRHEPLGSTGELVPQGMAAGASPPAPGPRTAPTASSTTCWSPRPCRCSTPGRERSPAPTTCRWWPPGVTHRPETAVG